MQVELTGRIVNVLPEQRFNGRNGEVVKNAFVIEWQDGGYTQHLCLEVVGQEKWNKMKQSIAVGNTVQCKFSVSSREYQGRWYTSTNCFYCANVGGQQQTVNNDPSRAVQSAQQAPAPQDDSSLPF